MTIMSTRRAYNLPQNIQAYSIPFTSNQLYAIGDRATEGIPAGFINKIRVAKFKAVADVCIAKRRPIKTYYKEGQTIAYVTDENVGTKKWPNIIMYVYCAKVLKVNKETIQTDDGRISKMYVLGKVKDDAGRS